MKIWQSIKTSLAIAVVCASAVVFAQGHNIHAWTKLSEVNGTNGQKVCTWVCRTVGQGIGGEHHKTTSGYGSCGSP
jgi:hypothetical protein